MSAFLLNPERIAQLADYLTTLNNAGFNYFGYSMPEGLQNELSDCRDKYGQLTVEKVYKRLWELNAAAVAGRYAREQEPTPEMPTYSPIQRYREQEAKPWQYELLKLTQCFLYQCCEDATVDTVLYKELRKVERAQAMRIIGQSPLYEAAAWG